MYTLPTLKYLWLQLVEYVTYYLKYLWGLYCDYPNEVKTAVGIIIAALVMMCILLISIFIRSRTRANENRLIQNMQYRFSSAINMVMYGDIDSNLSQAEMKQMILNLDPTGKTELPEKKKERHMLVRIIYMRYITDTPDNSKMHNIHVMLDVCGIPQFLEQQVNQGNLHCMVDALNMMRTFKLYINPWVINKLVKSSNIRVRRLAMYSAVMSSSDSDLDYFETDFFDNNSCIYDEIELGYALHRRQAAGLRLPNLAHWAHLQKNHSTRCLFVRLMRRFDQREYCSQLVDLFRESRHKKLIEEISRTWGYLHYVDGEKLLVDSLLVQPDDTKVAILHAITRMATGRSLDVLLDGYRNTTNPHVRFEALRCMYNYGDEGRRLFDRVERQASGRDRKFFDFFHNSITLYRIPLDKEQAYHPSVETIHSM